jgi:ribosomal protein S12 methylthiotransferase accessory factor
MAPSAADDLSRLRSLVSPYVGVARIAGELLRGPDDARLVTVGCLLADGEPTVGHRVVDHAGSSAAEADTALVAALGEAAERYAAAFLPESRLVRGRADRLGPAAVRPERFALCHERQYAQPGFPLVPLRSDTELAWVDGIRLPDGDPVLLPAQLVFLEAPAGDPHVAVPTSNGLACGRTYDDAVLAGLLELVERDAFMLAWSNRLSLPLLGWRDDPELVSLDDRYFAPAGLAYAAVDCSCFLDVPVVLGVVHGPPGEHGAVGVGAAAAPTVREAWWKALGEAFAVRRWARDSGFEHALDDPFSEWEIQSFEQHVLWWADPERAARAAFLDASPVRRPVGEVDRLEGADAWDRVEAVCRRLARHGLSAYAVDVTAPDIREAGLCVVRAVAPEFCGLDVVHGIRYLGGHRLYQAPVDAGLLERPLAVHELNPDPHPFP